jgi:NAD(P)-dependent dehydrogenase (short-subunit alcohol dehydrogenase family)
VSEQGPDFRLDGTVAIVTGAAGDIGRSYCRALAQAGADVLAADLDEAGVAALVGGLRSEGLNVTSVAVDIADETSARAMAATAIAEFGGIDILVNNAALMMQIPRAPLVECPIDTWDRVMKVNVGGALICAQVCVPAMRERGGGSIVNQSSGGAWKTWTPYGISKLAVVALTYGLAQELGESNIRVNAIAPGTIDTAAIRGTHPLDSPWWRERAEGVPLGTVGQPADLCGALIYLVSPAGRWVTGQTLGVDGGWVFRF